MATKNANKRAKHGKQKPTIRGFDKKIVATNRRARRDFDILDTYECGMVLRGSGNQMIRIHEGYVKDAEFLVAELVWR